MATSPEVIQTSSPVRTYPSLNPEWGSDTVPLKDFKSKRQVPGFAKVVKGNYMTLGTSKFSLNKQHTEVFIHSFKVGVKVLAHSVKRVEATSVTRRGGVNVYTTTRLYALDQRLAVPISYQGWFELLSEDGKSARPIVGVHDLSKTKPDKCLVRENIKAYIIGDENKPTFDKTKIVIAGEQLLLNGEFSMPSGREGKKVKLLRCIDSNGDFVYLSFDQKGTFTPIAGENDFVGVFNIRDIIRRFRLPLTVKLTMGVRPKVDPSRFTGMIRLDWVYTDETAFVCPIEKNHVRLLPVPLDANLHLASATNQQAMKSSELYNSLMTKCSRMINNYNNTLHLIVQVPEAAAKGKMRTSNPNVFSAALQTDNAPPKSARSKKKAERILSEIDDLYGYVRDGVLPNNIKFSYDSDEESYWEEPAYEPLDEFRARLKAIEAGEKVNYHAKYQPQDVSKLVIDFSPATGTVTESDYGVVWNTARDKNEGPRVPSIPPPLPPRPPDLELIPPSSPVNKADNRSNSSSGSGITEYAVPETPTNQTSTATTRTTPPAIPTTQPPPSPMSPPIPIPVSTPKPVSRTPSMNSTPSSKNSTPIRSVSASSLVRRVSHPDNADVTVVSNFGLVSSQSSNKASQGLSQSPVKQSPLRDKLQHSHSSGDIHTKKKGFSLFKSKSAAKDLRDSSSGSSSGNHQKHLARDFKDSDISSMTKNGSSSDSSGARATNMRKKMQTLYL